jgi:site-specific DNA-methyltransferase (adenine-specific)
MKPYYKDDYCEIWHGDCREILPSLPKCDLLLTDPPYGIEQKEKGSGSNALRGKATYSEAFDDTPDYIKSVVVPLIRTGFSLTGRVVVTPGCRCAFLYPQPSDIGAIHYPACEGFSRWGVSDCDLILYYGKCPHGNTGRKSFDSFESGEKNGHPCAKPIKLWTKILALSSNTGDTILDPFMGSGTTLRAAKDLQRKSIGIEIEEKYCEIAAKRLAQEVLAFK